MPTLKAIIVAPDNDHSSTVIFVHGLGDSGYGWEDVADQLSTEPKLKHVKWVLPHAPVIPVTGNGGTRMPAWFDIHSFETGAPRTEDEQGMLISTAALNELVQHEIDAGIRPDRIVFGGFSQGAAMTLLSGLTGKHKFAALVVLSGRLPLQSKIQTMLAPHAKDNQVFWGHGSADIMIPLSTAQKSVEVLEKLGLPTIPLDVAHASSHLAPGIEFHVYSGMGHSTSLEELTDLKSFLIKALPQERLPISSL